MLSSSRFNLDNFCIVYKSNNLNTNVYKKPNICLSQTPTQLQSQIIAVTILNIPSGIDQTSGGHRISWYLYSGCDHRLSNIAVNAYVAFIKRNQHGHDCGKMGL
jgi:hypothetical protein